MNKETALSPKHLEGLKSVRCICNVMFRPKLDVSAAKMYEIQDGSFVRIFPLRARSMKVQTCFGYFCIIVALFFN